MSKSQFVCERLRDPELYERGEALALFAQLRGQAPIWWTPMPDGGFWSVLRYADIQEVSRDSGRFSSARRYGGHRIHDERVFEGSRGLAASLLSMDGVEHSSHRAVLTPALTPAKLGALEARVLERAQRLLDTLADCDTCDFVDAVAAELPIQVLAELLGVPQSDRAHLLEWSNAIVLNEDPDICPSAEHMLRCMDETRQYAIKLWRERLRRPSDDLITMLVEAEVDGENISIEEYIAQFSMLLVAGNETVRNTLSGGLLLLSQHPEQRRRVQQDPSLWPGAVREILRHVTPAMHMRRSATQETEIAGQVIAEAEKVVLWYLSGNFDEQAFENAEAFDVCRKGPAHLSFGYGAHRCLGSRLAELQLRICFEQLFKRFPDIEPCGPARRVRSSFIHGIKSLPVRPGRQV